MFSSLGTAGSENLHNALKGLFVSAAERYKANTVKNSLLSRTIGNDTVSEKLESEVKDKKIANEVEKSMHTSEQNREAIIGKIFKESLIKGRKDDSRADINRLLKSLFESIIDEKEDDRTRPRQQQQQMPKEDKQSYHLIDSGTSDDNGNHGTREDPTISNSWDLVSRKQQKTDRNQNFVVSDSDGDLEDKKEGSSTPSMNNLRRLKNDLDELYSLVMEEKQL